jgi:serine/threonine protein kinase
MQEAVRMSAAYHATLSLADLPTGMRKVDPMQRNNQPRVGGQGKVEFWEFGDEGIAAVKTALSSRHRRQHFAGMCLQHFGHLICGAGVCKVLGVERSLDDIHMAMPRYDYHLGVWVDRAREDGRSTRGEQLPLFRSLARTVAVLHSHGIAHLDIKPANILVAKESAAEDANEAQTQAKFNFGLCDFSSASVFVSRNTEINVAHHLHTPDWEAPELTGQAQMKPKAFAASDVYSLGKVMAFVAHKGVLPPLGGVFKAPTSMPCWRDLAVKMMNKRYMDRPDMQDVCIELKKLEQASASEM